MKVLFLNLIGLVFLSSCAKILSPSNATSFQSSPSSPSDCRTVSGEGTVRIFGRAQYEAFQDTVVGGVVNRTPVTKPIRFAEVVLSKVVGPATPRRVACAYTDAQGNFEIHVTPPPGVASQVFNVSVISWTAYQGRELQIVKYNGIPHVVSHSFGQRLVDTNNVQLLATRSIASDNGRFNNGGAFSIMDSFILSNERIDQHCSECLSAKPFPKLLTFWEAGKDVYDYPSDPSDGYDYPLFRNLPEGLTTFFSVERSGEQEQPFIFILGGEDGVVNGVDSDHYDTSVTVHEYGHFMNYVYSEDASLGGRHNGNSVIDPRLAWSEGWANFFASFVIDQPYYIDVIRIDPPRGLWLLINLEENSVGASRDEPEYEGEANFRETPIARLLWDIYDGANDDSFDGSALGFQAIWKGGVHDRFVDGKFQSIGLFFDIQERHLSSVIATDVWDSLRTLHRFHNPSSNLFRELYALRLETGSSCNRSEFTVYKKDGSHSPFRNHRYFRYDHAGGPLKITMQYSSTNIPRYNVDIFLHTRRFNIASPLTTRALVDEVMTLAAGIREPNSNSETHSEVLQGVFNAGSYLIDVQSISGPTSGINFTLKLGDANGAALCPRPY